MIGRFLSLFGWAFFGRPKSGETTPATTYVDASIITISAASDAEVELDAASDNITTFGEG